MRLLILMMILLAFPALEIALLFELAEDYGWWVLLYLLLAAGCGWLLIMGERVVIWGRMVQTLEQGRHPVLSLLTSAKTMVAGGLLIFPGVITDVMAVLLLLIPSPAVKGRASRDDVIEGEWRRED